MRDSLLDSMHVGNDGLRLPSSGREVRLNYVDSIAERMMCLFESPVGFFAARLAS
jgi:hypothetical protein